MIVQNFRAKPGTAMADAPEPGDEEFLAAVATTRIVMGPHVSVQAPPNLSDPAQQLRLLDAGISDWGGVSPLTPDHVNPERPWPAIEALAATTAAPARRSASASRSTRGSRSTPITSWPGKMRRPVEALARRRRPRARGRRPRARRLAGPGRHVEAADDRPHVREGTRGRTPGGRRDVYGEIPSEDPVTAAWAARDGDAGAPRRGDPPGAPEGRAPPPDLRRRGARPVPGRGRRPRRPPRRRRRPP